MIPSLVIYAFIFAHILHFYILTGKWPISPRTFPSDYVVYRHQMVNRSRWTIRILFLLWLLLIFILYCLALALWCIRQLI